MKRLILIIALLLVCSVTALAADLRLPASVSGDVGDFITVKADTACTVVRWKSYDAGLSLFPVDLLKDTHTAVVTGKVAGTYRLLAVTSDAQGPSDIVSCLVTVGVPPGPGPTPPGPTPIPPAPPIMGPLHVTIIFDPANDTPAQAALRTSQMLRTALRGKGHVLRVFDANDPTLVSTGHKALMDKAGGPPVVVLQTSDGVTHPTPQTAIKMPTTEADLLALITKVGG